MTADTQNSLLALVEQLKAKSPKYLDLMTAKTDADLNNALDALLEQAVDSLESNKKNFNSLNEEGLTAALAMAISMPGLSVSQETHSNGHVDIIIQVDYCFPVRKFLGEAKIYNGPIYHYKGIQQLLDRYATGRYDRGLLIAYYRKQGIKTLVNKLRDEMNNKLPLAQQGETLDHPVKWWFISKHKHCSDELLSVIHISCNLYESDSSLI